MGKKGITKDKAWLELIGRISSGVATDEELKQYNAWCNAWQSDEQSVPDFASLQSKMLGNINQKINQEKVLRLSYYKIASIAAAITVAVFGIWFFFATISGSDTTRTAGIKYKDDVLPGKNTATLTLANGENIQLSDAKDGVIINASSLKYDDGTAIETGGIQEGNSLAATTPRGGNYQVTLPDGSRVWMNADSRLVFPAKFSGKSREVSLEGEAYFEVAKDRIHPFIVKSRSQRIEVLGTHFNVNSYTDETAIKTTLLEGSVKVSDRNGSEAILKPGEAAINRGNIRVEQVNTAEAVAWKDGNIAFREKTLEGIMRELSRWYDISVVYAADAPTNVTFTGVVSKTRNLSSVLEGMQTTGSVKFKIEGKTVTVTK
jgi:transmembrane sensor